MRTIVSLGSIKYFSAYTIFLIVFVFVFFEIFLRIIPPFSTGTGAGIGKRWTERYWNPINSMGYRDEEFQFDGTGNLAVFLGDSFTAGHGVRFDETYYYVMKERFDQEYASVNLEKNGSSTSDQVENYQSFLTATNATPDIVFYQYFGNDIEDFFERPKYKSSKLSKNLAKISNVYSMISSFVFSQRFGQEYFDGLKETYYTGELMSQHMRQVEELHGAFKDSKATIVFIVFPFLENEAVLQESQEMYVNSLRKFFVENCARGDIFFDVSNLALDLETPERIANFMDAHPSAKLHGQVASTLADALTETSLDSELPGLMFCSA